MSGKTKRNKKQKQNRIRKIITVAVIMLSPFIGIFAGIYGYDKVENYYNLKLFVAIFGLIGIISGYFFANFVKPYLHLDKKQIEGYSQAKLFFIIAFIGIMIAFGSKLNSALSKVSSCDNYKVLDKTYREYRYMRAGANFLIVNINGETEYLNCKFKYWESVIIGQEINICIYESKLGFDYIELTNE